MTANSDKKRTRLSPEDRREQLVKIGARLFAERPFSDVWIEEVAQTAGVSRGLVYHYFPNKRDFFAAVLRKGADLSLRMTAPDDELPPRERLRASIDHAFEYVERNENAVRSIYRGMHSADEEVRAIVREVRDKQIARILTYLPPEAAASPALRLALEGWLQFNQAVMLDWMDTRDISRDEAIDLCVASCIGIIAAALHVDPRNELPELVTQHLSRTAESA
jgi:AcrR family transcriptional regulator